MIEMVELVLLHLYTSLFKYSTRATTPFSPLYTQRQKRLLSLEFHGIVVQSSFA